jgi:hypothetical protein
VTGRARGMVGLLAPMAESSARPPPKAEDRHGNADGVREQDSKEGTFGSTYSTVYI